MNEQINTTETNTVKPCRKCGAMDRYKSGNCLPCQRERVRKYREANKDTIVESNRKYREANKDTIAEYIRKWAEANREKVIERHRKYREANKDTIAEYSRKYREANKDTIAEQKRKWREVNPEREAERSRNWRKANPEKCKVIKHNRRAKIKGNGGTLSKGIEQTLMALQKGKCACCGKSLKHGHHLDHVIPIALGGTNTDDNVQLLTPACNLSKGAKHPVDYMRSKGKLI